MLAKLAREMPVGDQWSYEPKWDGFRCIVFRDGDDIELGSRNEKPLTRYFPDLIEPLRAALPDGAVVDGEIVIKTDDGLDFDLLSLRIHPADEPRHDARRGDAGRVRRVRPARRGQDRPARAAVRGAPGRARARCSATPAPQVHLTPITRDPEKAQEWFETFEGAGLDGVVAKDLTGEYKEGERGWLKVKHLRTADCVVAGFRIAQGRQGRRLAAARPLRRRRASCTTSASRRASTADRRAELVEELAPYRTDALDGHPWAEWGGAEAQSRKATASACPARRAGGTRRRTCPGSRCGSSSSPRSRTSTCSATGSATPPGSSAGAPTASPSSCTYEQLEVPVPMELEQVFGS